MDEEEHGCVAMQSLINLSWMSHKYSAAGDASSTYQESEGNRMKVVEENKIYKDASAEEVLKYLQ
jgi:hypothetical protein